MNTLSGYRHTVTVEGGY